MQNLEPPEVPLELLSQVAVTEQKKEGFFKKLFSKKSNLDSSSNSYQNHNEKYISKDNLPLLNLFETTNDSSNKLSNISNNSLDMNTNNIEFPTDKNNFDSIINSSNSNSSFVPLSTPFSLIDNQLDKSASVNLNNNSKTKLAKGKSKGKLKKGVLRHIKNLDESNQFDWTREVKDQEILIHDSNRFNQDVNILITTTDKYLDDVAISNNSSLFASEHLEVPIPEKNMIIPSLTPMVKPLSDDNKEDYSQVSNEDKIEHSDFAKVSLTHKKLKSNLEHYLKSKKLFNNKQKVAELFKQYDSSIEKVIEDKELVLVHKKRELNRFETHLKDQEKDIKSVHSFIMKLDSKLKEREKNLNALISKSVEKELARRLIIEKRQVTDELKKIALLNSELKKKIKLLDEDNLRFKKEHEHMVELERQKLTQMQSLYERKLNELNNEKNGLNAEKNNFEFVKKSFEEKRKKALDLLSRADNISKELVDIDKAKAEIELNRKDIADSRADIEVNKNIIIKEFNEDKELKLAIERAESDLISERENLDNLVFSKYLENRLKNVQPAYLKKEDDWRAELKSHPLYQDIFNCRRVLAQNDILQAKSLYNAIRKSYDLIDSTKKEKEALYTALRELYNDIQLKIVDLQQSNSNE
jgi:hypothetical protein